MIILAWLFAVGVCAAFVVWVSLSKIGNDGTIRIVYEDGWPQPIRMTDAEYRRYLSNLENS